MKTDSVPQVLVLLKLLQETMLLVDYELDRAVQSYVESKIPIGGVVNTALNIVSARNPAAII